MEGEVTHPVRSQKKEEYRQKEENLVGLKIIIIIIISWTEIDG